MGRPRGFAHATFEDAEAAKRAVDAAGFEPVFLHGRQLRVEISNPRRAHRLALDCVLKDPGHAH